MRRSAPAACAALAVVLLLPARAGADEELQGGLGLNHMLAGSLHYSTGSRWLPPDGRPAEDGSWNRQEYPGWGLGVHLEGVMLVGETMFGSRTGLELDFDFGYEGYKPEGIEADEINELGVAGDLSFGFPFTILDRLWTGTGSFRLGLAPGLGMSLQHAYVYVRGRMDVTILPDQLDLQVSYRWSPMEASFAWEEETGLNEASLRVSAFWAVDEDLAVQVFIDNIQANIEQYRGSDEGYPQYGESDPLVAAARGKYHRLTKVGVGMAFY